MVSDHFEVISLLSAAQRTAGEIRQKGNKNNHEKLNYLCVHQALTSGIKPPPGNSPSC